MLSLFEMCRPAPRKCVITPLGFDEVVQVNLMLLLEILDVLRPMTLPGAFSLVVAVFEATAEQPTLAHASTVSVGIVYGCKLVNNTDEVRSVKKRCSIVYCSEMYRSSSVAFCHGHGRQRTRVRSSSQVHLPYTHAHPPSPLSGLPYKGQSN